MAFEIRKIDPLDLQPRKAIGVTLPFTGKAVFNQSYQSKDAIQTNILNFFLTSKGERFMNPTFGNGLQRYIFDNMTEDKTKEIETRVKQDLKIYFPTVIPTEIQVTGYPDSNTVQFSMKYYVQSTNIEDEIVINFEQ